ncbi:unnamed protein product [Rotaria magnacalcarata]|uniref:Uncharacterized protein n=1 Tax=Rotaria magnacalcarata TaxID=392030 RepID=A0A816YGI8_9BILA|nr:unnamed protein product [Rotaria magnacalcarata]CAF1605970.1 unnamed protein product [Rotaria magnacalcarata]CAF2156522.1 unnamed protein product [Rotaria magnacalcarata]CAF3930702.1 unnamed protein product [Rotaria magnacalcarata]CAF4042101.1 unnamed protein product [Rotaria magnacalcarata]
MLHLLDNEAAPLVSLEQAVAPITNLFDCIEENVWVAKENSKTPSYNLSHEESAAIHLYTIPFDSDPSVDQLLNSTLRGENRDNFKPWFAYLKLSMTTLHKLPSHPQTAWRGVRGVDLKVRIFSSTLPPQMRETVIKVMRHAIAEGTDQTDIESIVVSELIQHYGGNWWVRITPEPTIYTFMARKLFFSAKIGKYNINALQQRSNT